MEEYNDNNNNNYMINKIKKIFIISGKICSGLIFTEYICKLFDYEKSTSYYLALAYRISYNFFKIIGNKFCVLSSYLKELTKILKLKLILESIDDVMFPIIKMPFSPIIGFVYGYYEKIKEYVNKEFLVIMGSIIIILSVIGIMYYGYKKYKMRNITNEEYDKEYDNEYNEYKMMNKNMYI